MSSVAVTQALGRELGRSEKIVWAGTPRQGPVFRSADAFLVPFSLLWTGFAVVWEHGVISSHATPFMVFSGVPFLLLGVYFVVGRFFLDSYQRTRTYYAVTDERIIILRGIASREIKSLPLQTLSEMTLREKSDGSGTITFGPIDPRYAMWAGTDWPGMGRRMPPSFDLIPDVRSVYDAIRESQATCIRKA